MLNLGWKFFSFLAEITGASEEFCRRKHCRHHPLIQIEYGGKYMVKCSVCDKSFGMER